jgi:hypothetical protein
MVAGGQADSRRTSGAAASFPARTPPSVVSASAFPCTRSASRSVQRSTMTNPPSSSCIA